jgi:uncharacterized OB-fold protein
VERETYLPAGLPAPGPARDGVDAAYWEGLRAHELRLQRCGGCGLLRFPPEWLCHACLSFDFAWEAVPAKGRIFSWERVWHPVHRALTEACPYLVVLVEVEGGPGVRLVGNLLGDPGQEVMVGAPVEGVFEDHGEGFTLLQWRLLT